MIKSRSRRVERVTSIGSPGPADFELPRRGISRPLTTARPVQTLVMKRLTIFNYTGEVLVCQSGLEGKRELLVIPHSLCKATTISKYQCTLTLTTPDPCEIDKEGWTIKPDVFTIRLPMALGAAWKVVDVCYNCPWRIYRSRVRLSSTDCT